MQVDRSRAGRWPLTLTIVAVAACGDEPAAPRVTPPLAPNAAVGTILTVTSGSGGTEPGSLRWAAAQVTGGETIRFDPSVAGDTIVVQGPVLIPNFATIDGPQGKGVTISGGDLVQVIDAPNGATLRNLDIRNGYAVEGAGIRSRGKLTLEHVAVFRNKATVSAGGIFGDSITLINSTVALNEAPVHAAGVSYSNRGTFTAVNSTIVYNGATQGIAPHGVTIDGPKVTLRNTIVAGNGDQISYWNCYNTQGFTYEGMNLSDDTTCGNTSGMKVTPNAWFGSIYNWGGPSSTVYLPPESPAINTGVNCSVTVDQRYVPRDSKCDIGAFEFNSFTTVTPTVDAPVNLIPTSGAAVVTGTVKCSRAEVFVLGVQLNQNQKAGKTSTVVRGNGNATINCTTSPQPWSIVVTPWSGAFLAGSASASAFTNNAPQWITPISVDKTVKIVRPRT